MADNVAITAGAGTTIATDDVGGGVQVQRTKLTWGPDGTANDADVATGKPLPVQIRTSTGVIVGVAEDAASGDGDGLIPIGVIQQSTPADTAGTNGDYANLQMSGGKLWVAPLCFQVTVDSTLTRAANTTQYAVDDAIVDASATAGGLTFTNAARKSGGSGIITDLLVSFDDDAATPLQGELLIFDQAATISTDNAAYAVTDAEARTLVAKIPFTLTDFGNNDNAHVQGLSIGFTCVGSANLRYHVRAKNAYSPTANSGVLNFRLKIIQTD